ncbi:hypothetical protein MRX96_008528 [Rhipicephalus microplus]
MANAYSPRLFLVQMLSMAYLLTCFADQPCAAGESVVLPSLEMPRSVVSPATDQEISLFPRFRNPSTVVTTTRRA